MNYIELQCKDDLKKFHLPRYNEIPDVGLFLEQTVRYINIHIGKLGNVELTPSMVSNYVKNKYIPAPVKKQYQRDHIGYLIFIALAKTVMPLDDISNIFTLQKEHFTPEIAYNYFCDEFENIIQFVFGNKDFLKEIGSTNNKERVLLRTVIITIAHKIYLDSYLRELKER
ncbi:MAG: DUF1836 domain-containing protein [Lachnospiraceae bacterium]|nr:DUF1836 domain-containing protein [Lachnospiraceae bacterium]